MSSGGDASASQAASAHANVGSTGGTSGGVAASGGAVSTASTPVASAAPAAPAAAQVSLPAQGAALTDGPGDVGLPLEHYAQGADDSVPPGLAAHLDGFDPREHALAEGRLVSPLDGGARAVLTLHPGLQAHITDRFAQYEVPYGALVAIEPSTGRVLAYVSHSSRNPRGGDLVLDATPPTASVFKVVTGAALIDAGIGADTNVCYHGGASRLELSDLTDNRARDRWCATLSDAMGGSINAVFAKLADRHLSPAVITRYASAFAWGQRVPFDIPVRPSPAEVPTDRLEFARTSAGFWHMHMSPLHGALVAATIANDGQMPHAAVVSEVLSARGERVYQHQPAIYRAVLSRRTARRVGEMMERTVSHGTARRSFHDNAGNAFLPGVRIAGKTGTLTGSDPYRGYTWWVGFAPADAPTIAVAALVVNDPAWRVKASYMAREALRYYLVEAPRVDARAEARSE
ncbi:MAG: penicillin-binding protein [Myxococcales bacterium]|nr:penicillin-binding protein [Myxococcales bacterium]